MAVTVDEGPEGVVLVRVSGRVSSREWGDAQRSVARLMGNKDAVSLLAIMEENFQGWEGTDWNDLSFQVEHDRQIARLAIVAEGKWKDDVLMFAGQGLRDFEIRYFAPAESTQARAWVTSPAGESAT